MPSRVKGHGETPLVRTPAPGDSSTWWWRLRHGWGRATGERTLTESELRLWQRLEAPGCPVCHESAGSDAQYFFWFFNENYGELVTLDRLTRSLGFCRAHADALIRSPLGSSQLAHVYEYMTRILLGRLSTAIHETTGRSRDPVPAAPAMCPACEAKTMTAERNTFWLSNVLKHAPTASRYGQPGLLCYPHLRSMSVNLPDRELETVLSIHEASMQRELAGLGHTDRASGAIEQLLPALRLAVGHEHRANAYPLLTGTRVADATAARTRDVVGSFLASLGTPICCVCLEIRRVWLEWGGWINAHAHEAGRLDDLLPTCPEHVWAMARGAGPALAHAVARRALQAAFDEITTAVHPRAKRPDIADWLAGPRLGRAKVMRVSREPLMRSIRCPVCARLALARDRTIGLLFALFEDPAYRPAIEAGYGLCVHHFVRALALAPGPRARVRLIELECAKLSLLVWELQEAMRKDAWQYRPEAKASETTAWKRAVWRYSGSLQVPEGPSHSGLEDFPGMEHVTPGHTDARQGRI